MKKTSEATRYRFRCRVNMHDWRRWSPVLSTAPGAVTIVDDPGADPAVYDQYFIQRRECADCGIAESRKVRP